MAFTENQLLAITERDKNILVSASAGSGKTTVLAERILSKILDDRINVDSLLIVTFTQLASQEMKQKIINKISLELQKQPENSFLQEQMTRINKSQISTIDSFFIKIVKSNFKMLDIDPNFRMIKGDEFKLLESTSLEEFLEKYYEESDEEFLNVVDAFTKKSNDKEFTKIFLQIYEQSQNTINPKLWLENAHSIYNISSQEEYFNSSIFSQIIEYSREYLNEIVDIFDKIKLITAGVLDFECNSCDERSLEYFLNCELMVYKNLISSIEAKKYHIFINDLNSMKFITFAPRFLKENQPMREIVKDLRENCKKIIKKLKASFFFKSVDEIINESAIIYPTIKKFCELIIEFDEFFMNIKREKNTFSFNDISHFCLKILLNNGEPTQVALQYQSQFDEVIIDEYQDSNLIQEVTLASISKNNRFMVGDIKQCIYKFRQADTSIFNDKFNTYFDNPKIGKRIDLNANFRSREHVVNSINTVFENIMTTQLGEVKYDENSKLYFNAPLKTASSSQNICKKCELNIIDYEEEKLNDLKKSIELDELDLKAEEIEAHFVAQKIKSFFDENLLILDDDEYRPIQYKDIVILMRSSKKFDIFSNVLKEYNIPTFSKSSGNFYNFIEIKTIINILKVLDNPLQDLPLTAVMYSPIFNFSANELLEIRLSSKNVLLWDSVLEYRDSNSNKLHTKISEFLLKIEQWQITSRSLSVNELLSFIYQQSNYYNYLGLVEGGEIRQANLLSLLEKSLSFAETGSHGIFGFISYIEKIKAFDSESEVKISSEDENVIKIMTIHKSKGLEFPIVFLSDLSKNFNNEDIKQSILFDKKFSLGVSVYSNLYDDDCSPRKIIESMQKSIIKHKIIDENYSEEMRVLYVAMTRAKENLILTSTIKNNLEKKLTEMESIILKNNNKFLYRYFRNGSSKNYLSWIYASIKNFDELNTWALNKVFIEDVVNNIPKTKIQDKPDINKISIFKNLMNIINTSENKSISEDVKSNLNWQYPNLVLQNLQSAISVSEIKKIHQKSLFEKSKTIIFEDTLNFPEFYISKNEMLTPAEVGTIYHKIFENIDFDRFSNNELPNLFNYLLDNNLLSEKELNAVDKNKILSFCNSNIVKRIKLSSKVSRECVFTIGLKPSEIYSDEILKNVDSSILVSGIMDLYFEEGENIILLDYKSDNIKSDATFIKIYKPQLAIYKKALERATKKQVTECYIYSILGEKCIPIF